MFAAPRTPALGTRGLVEVMGCAGRKQGAGHLPKWGKGWRRQPAEGRASSCSHSQPTEAPLSHPAWPEVWGMSPTDQPTSRGGLGSQAGAARVPCGWWTQTTRTTPCCTPRAPETSARTPTWPFSTVCAPQPGTQRGTRGRGSGAETFPASPSCHRPRPDLQGRSEGEIHYLRQGPGLHRGHHCLSAPNG